MGGKYIRMFKYTKTMTKYNFTKQQFEEIKSLLKRRLNENRDQQKKTRARIRKLGFNISDFFNRFSDKDFQDLFQKGLITIVDERNSFKQVNPTKLELPSTHKNLKKKSLPPIIDNETEILILGTMPGDNSIENQKYYNSSKNQFWKIIFNIFNEGKYIEDYESKIELLKKNKIGLWDVLHNCERDGSSDSNIVNPVANDFPNIFSKYKNIKILIFNGKDSYSYYKQLVENDSDKKLIQLNSTSSLNSHKTLNEKIIEWRNELRKNATQHLTL